MECEGGENKLDDYGTCRSQRNAKNTNQKLYFTKAMHRNTLYLVAMYSQVIVGFQTELCVGQFFCPSPYFFCLYERQNESHSNGIYFILWRIYRPFEKLGQLVTTSEWRMKLVMTKF